MSDTQRTAVLEDMRDRIARQFLGVLFWLGFVVLATAIVRTGHTPGGWIAISVFVACQAGVVLAWLRRDRLHRPLLLVAATMVGGVGAAASLAALGLAGNGAALLIALTGMLTVLSGRRAGVLALGFILLCYVVVFIGVSSGVLLQNFDAVAWFYDPRHWVAGIVQFACLAALVLVPVGGMRDGLIHHAGEAEAARLRLAAEIAERARLERALRASEERFGAAFRDSPDAIAILRAEDGTVLEVNAAFVRLAGGGHEALAGTPLESIRGLGEPALATALVGAIRERGRAEETALRVLTSGGEVRELLAGGALLRAGEAAFAMVVLRDVTEARADEREMRELTGSLEAQVRRQTAALEDTTRELETLTYAVSHNLRTPIRALNAYAHLLSQSAGAALGAENLARLERLDAHARRMGERVDALLDLARMQRRDLARATVDLSALATEVIDTLRRPHPARGVAVEIAAGLSARADPALARRLLMELLGNAWKFTAGTPSAVIEFGRDAENFFVRDNGVGFDAAEAADLFQPFVRLGSARTFEGTGTGLAMAARIVRRHGGRIQAEGAPGAGAVFRFTLPDPQPTRT